MSLWRPLNRGLRALARRGADDREVADEVRYYFELSAAAHRARGLDPEAAERAARRECGDPDATLEKVRAYGWENAVAATLADLGYAARQLRRDPGFAVASVLVLGLGIGVGAAMFSVLDAVLLRPLPYRHADQLVEVQEAAPGQPRPRYPSVPDVRDWQARSRSFTQIAYYAPRAAGLELPHEADVISAVAASANLFATLGVAPALGRGFVAADQSQPARVVVLSDAMWRSLFAADPRIVGRTIRLDAADYSVIGAMPAGFTFPYGEATLWTLYLPGKGGSPRDSGDMRVIARLRPGVGLAAAQAELSGIQGEIARRYANLHLPVAAQVRGYHDTLVTGVRATLLSVSAAVGLVWLIACLSVAGLLLTRFAARRRELAVRAALGASRGRLARQLLAECLLLGTLAGLAGLGLAYAFVAALGSFLSRRLPLGGRGIPMSPEVLLGLVGLTLASVLLAGMAPSWLAALGSTAGCLKIGGGAAGDRAQSRLRDSLVVAELALALVLLAASGMLLRTLYALRSIPLGFTTENVITTMIRVPPGRYARQSIRQDLDQPLLARLQALPGVRAAAITSVVPLNRSATILMYFDMMPGDGMRPDQTKPSADVRFVSPEYPAVFGITLERGRFFDARRDTPTSQRVIVINHSLAAAMLPGRNPLGQQLLHATIIGVLADVHDNGVAAPPGPVIYFPTSQLDPGSQLYGMGAMFAQVAVRTRTPPEALVPAVRAALHAIAPDLPAGSFTTMRELAADSIGDQILAARLLGLFAAAALAIALAGLYGLLAYGVTQRTRELGIRMALGAERRQIVALVLGRAAWLLGLGIVGGLALTLACSHMLAAYLYGVPPRDPLTLAGVALLLAAAGLWAAYLPARRAARVSPVEALRAE